MNLGKFDLLLIESLKKDSRVSVRTLAKALNCSRRTVASHIQKLEKGVILSYDMLWNPSLLGWDFCVTISLRVDPAKLLQIIQYLLGLEEVCAVNHITGRFDLIVYANFQNRNALDKFIIDELKVDGILSSYSRILLRQYYVGQKMPDEMKPETIGNIKTDDIDLEILRILRADAKTSVGTIAKKLGLKSPTISSRISRLKKFGVIRGFTITTDPDKMDIKVQAQIYLKVSPTNFKETLKRISMLEGVTWMDETTGEYDLHLFVDLKDAESLRDFLRNKLGEISEIREFESQIVLDTHQKFLM